MATERIIKTYKTYDTYPPIDLAITSGGAVKDLTGYTVTFNIKFDGSTLTKTASMISTTGGTCRVSLSASDLSSSGVFLCDIKLTKGTEIETIWETAEGEDIAIKIEDKIA